MNIAVLGWPTITNGDISPECFGDFGSYKCYDVLGEDEICRVVEDAEVILVNRVFITKRVIESAPKLIYIGSFATGYNNIDVAAAKKRGITVTNIPGYSTEAVASHTMGFLLALALQLVKYDAHVKSGGWSFKAGCDCFPYRIEELGGKTLGLFGFGSIGRKVAELSKAFGMDIIYYSRTRKDTNIARYVDFDTLLRCSDFLSLHAPLTNSTANVFNRDAFSKMKPTAYFINTARGGLVDEKALADALENNVISGAAVDVTAAEPLCESSPLFGAKNCIFTPHVAWGAVETRRRLVRLGYENLKKFAENQPINVVEV